MSKFIDTKIWVGDDPYLMKTVIDTLEEAGCVEHKVFNSRRVCKAGVYIDADDRWYYSMYPSRDSTFTDVKRRELKPVDVLPKLSVAQLCGKTIWIGADPLF